MAQTDTQPETLALHATAVAIDGVALLLTGPSGSGKSDLALRLIDGGARLIADDQVELLAVNGRLCCRFPLLAPSALKGRIEVRGLGIMQVPLAEGPAPVQWLVELVPGDEVERLPTAENRDLLGCAVPVLRLAPFESSAPAKLRLAAARGPGLEMGRE